jgi:hypothetical protein
MRRTLRTIGYGCLGLLSFSSLIWIIDWLGRWDWLVAYMVAHPQIAQFLHTPFPYLILTLFTLISLRG